MFVHLCKTFLRIIPFISLFRYFFHLKPHPRSDYISPLGKKNLFFDYDLVDSVREWRSEWFYVGNMLSTLVVHSDYGPSVNDRWEKNPLSCEELKKI
jgi:hypothetical protein